ncbi:hypothetical protein HSBAA_56500 [Vreelandella sulfidaeris]|uniref:Uncharacterized protein n=1 Tax=Vreelandella sulfidaeris TaxID=115553 RepID=A0A455UN20_9GAMM|nr:hypothetical protein HSBAA_56500 [Halomonas sulfidaeris]
MALKPVKLGNLIALDKYLLALSYPYFDTIDSVLTILSASKLTLSKDFELEKSISLIISAGLPATIQFSGTF